MDLADLPDLSYGTIDRDYVATLAAMDPSDDGPVWMVNLMRYREQAVYADGRDTDLTGREADDRYAPFGPFREVGAELVFLADVEEQLVGDDQTWDRIAVVRYPTRRSFLDMQDLPEYVELHEHKEAGMEFTIVMGTEPVATGPGTAADGSLVLRVRRVADGGAGAEPDGVTPVAHFTVDGVILGDARTWNDVRFDRVRPDAIAAPARSAVFSFDSIALFARAEEATASVGSYWSTIRWSAITRPSQSGR